MMQQPSLYLNLCAEFFDLDKPMPAFNEYAFYMHYVEQASGPILEPMCGSGRYLIPMLEDGYSIEGFDASPFMLNALKNKCAQKKCKPNVWQQFLEDIEVEKSYPLIFIPDCSFCLFLDNAKIKTCLAKIYSLLQPGGTFVFDLETIYSIPAHVGIWQGKAYTKENGQLLMFNMLPLPVKNNIATVICRYELIEKTSIIKTEIEYFQIKLYEPMEMDSLLQSVGFKHIKQRKAYDFNAEPSARDHTIVYECVK
jgi:SAM-dependent methyltransferase